MTRSDRFSRLFGGTPPSLWCAPITHLDAEGRIDFERTQAHWRFFSPWVKAVMIAGVPGDGWELNDSESQELIDHALVLTKRLDFRLLIGALRPRMAESVDFMRETFARFSRRKLGAEAKTNVLAAHGVCGFAVCPPEGKPLTRERIETELRQALATGFPLALCHVPSNLAGGIEAELLASLAAEFDNLIVFAEQSGDDTVAQSPADLEGIFLLRGTEGHYANHLRTGGGRYDGWLLSSANAFGAELAEIRRRLDAGDKRGAAKLSERLGQFMEAMQDLVKGLPDGNSAANAAKAIDHFLAHGPRAQGALPPRLHSGRRLSSALLRRTGELLVAYEFMPARGYLE